MRTAKEKLLLDIKETELAIQTLTARIPCERGRLRRFVKDRLRAEKSYLEHFKKKLR